MARKGTRSDSASAAVNAMLAAAQGAPECPKHVRLRPKDIPFWDGIVRARTRDEWSSADLVVAGQLARAQADIESEQEALDRETSILTNPRGTPVANPRVHVLEALARREMALMRSLRMAGAAVGDVRERASKIRAQRAAEEAREQLETDEEADDLLAK